MKSKFGENGLGVAGFDDVDVNFTIVLKEVDGKSQISIVVEKGNETLYAEKFVEEIDRLGAFLKKIEDYSGLKSARKIIKMLILINQYYGGEQRLIKQGNYNLVKIGENGERVEATYDELDDLIDHLSTLKTKINRERFANKLCDVIDSLN